MKDLSDSRIDMINAAEFKPKVLPFLSPLHDAIHWGVRKLIKAGENPMEEDINSNSCVYYAAMLGKLEILKYLIEEVECPPGTEGWCGKNVLHMAAETNHLPMVQYLMQTRPNYIK